jgi:predicted nuclease of predicted toxin-antitoxin system
LNEIRFLIDECLSKKMVAAIQRRDPTVEVEFVGKSGILPKATPDPEVLEFDATHGYVLVSSDETTMPRYAFDRFGADLPMCGLIMIANPALTWDEIVADILTIHGASTMAEWSHKIQYLPL